MQEIQPTLPERWLSLELFTDYHRIIGQILTSELRTNGVMNDSATQLLVNRASTTNLMRPAEESLDSGFARVSKESILLAIPNDEHETERLERASKIYNRGELLQQRGLIVLGNYEISGNLHLPPDVDLQQVLLYRNEFFIGVTDVSITFSPGPATRFTASSALINRGRVDFICAGAP